jgi:hypothetical protein
MVKWLRQACRRSRPKAARDISIAAHERPLGRIMHDLDNAPFHPLRTLEQARDTPNAYLIMEGDWGGQIYLTAPVHLLRCTSSDLASLLAELDDHAWSCNEGAGCGFFFETRGPLEGVSGGMGGGITMPDIWLHPDLVQAGFEARVRQILLGEHRE